MLRLRIKEIKRALGLLNLGRRPKVKVVELILLGCRLRLWLGPLRLLLAWVTIKRYVLLFLVFTLKLLLNLFLSSCKVISCKISAICLKFTLLETTTNLLRSSLAILLLYSLCRFTEIDLRHLTPIIQDRK